MASLADLKTPAGSVTMGWGPSSDTNADSLYNGAYNTQQVVDNNNPGDDTAIKVCADYTTVADAGGTIDDWYLPAIWELRTLFDQALGNATRSRTRYQYRAR